MEEFPHLQHLYNQMKSHGLRLVAVDVSDDAATVRKYRHDGKFTFDLVIDSKQGASTVGERFGVQATPTNYVLDPNGKVVFRSEGFDEKGIRSALTKLGVK